MIDLNDSYWCLRIDLNEYKCFKLVAIDLNDSFKCLMIDLNEYKCN